MTEDFIVDLKDYIRVERKYSGEAWCDPDDVQAALDEIERLQEEVQGLKSDSTIFIIERGEAICENSDLREEIERLRAALREIEVMHWFARPCEISRAALAGGEGQ